MRPSVPGRASGVPQAGRHAELGQQGRAQRDQPHRPGDVGDRRQLTRGLPSRGPEAFMSHLDPDVAVEVFRARTHLSAVIRCRGPVAAGARSAGRLRVITWSRSSGHGTHLLYRSPHRAITRPGLEDSQWGARSCSAEARRGYVGGALELLQPSQVHRAAPLEARSIEVEALALVAGLGTQLLQPLGLAVGHDRWRRCSRSASAARVTGDMRRAFEDPCLIRRATCFSFAARSWSLRLIWSSRSLPGP
jgi:hypothetical protein